MYSEFWSALCNYEPGKIIKWITSGNLLVYKERFNISHREQTRHQKSTLNKFYLDISAGAEINASICLGQQTYEIIFDVVDGGYERLLKEIETLQLAQN